MRLPYRQRFAIILNEFGAGLAGRGKDLRKVIRGANPALREFDRVIEILAKQNKVLAEGAKNGDKVLAEWAARAQGRSRTSSCRPTSPPRRRPSAARTSSATSSCSRSSCGELRPTMVRLGALSEQMLPVVQRPRAGRRPT